jgi:hypothetical protein
MKNVCLMVLLLFSLSAQSQEIMLLKSSGKVVIGDTTQIQTPGNYNLYVQHGILTERVKVALKTTAEWSDQAFGHTPAIEEVAGFIETKSHLPGMPSAQELVTSGYELKEMDARLLAQIEWLWQHVIRLDAENKALRQQLNAIISKGQE